MKKIVILDFYSGKVFVRSAENLKDENGDILTEGEDILNYYENELEIHADDCQYMITSEDINII